MHSRQPLAFARLLGARRTLGQRLHRPNRQRPAHVQSLATRHLDCFPPPGAGVILVLENAFRIATGPLSALFTAGLWVLSLVFLLRAVGNFRSFGFFKTITETPFAHWDTWLYSPLCLLLTFLAAALACSPRVR
jgi:uncharacterized protein DUF3995